MTTFPSNGDNAKLETPFSIGDLVSLLRPHQWVKNIIIFAGPAASLKLSSPQSLYHATLAFVSFCLAASSIYAINDAIDRNADACHPTKRLRPIARGAISPATAYALAAVLISIALLIAKTFLNGTVTAILGTYFVLMVAYSLALKKQALLDVIVLATGFVLRAWAGAASVDVVASQWLIGCVFTLCLFFGFGKRQCELSMLGDDESAVKHRATLIRYTPRLLSHLLTTSAAVAVMTFLIYTMEPGHAAPPFHKEHLFYTLPIVIYGIFRYTMCAELGKFAGPTEILLKDKMMIASIVLWLAIAMFIAYHDPIVSAVGLERLTWDPVPQ